MKNNKFLIIIMLMFFITVLTVIFFNKNNIEVYCSPANEGNESCKEKADIPNYDNLLNTILYYKLDDNCNFQTLVYQTCFGETQTGDSKDNNAYSILGRFNGKKINDKQFEISTLEIKNFFHKFNENDESFEYRIGGAKVLPSSTSDYINIAFNLIKQKPIENKLDYVYGIQNKEHPIIIDKDAIINFFVIDSEDGFLKSRGCVDISPEAVSRGVSGGYECNGKGTVSGGGG